MLRLKYYSLDKIEKQNLKNNFYNTEVGKVVKYRLTRLLLTGIALLMFSIYLFINPANKWDIISGIILNFISLTFIGASFKVRIDKLNNYLITQKK